MNISLDSLKKKKKKDHIHITFIAKYYNYSILVIVNFLLCLIYKLNFILGMHV